MKIPKFKTSAYDMVQIVRIERDRFGAKTLRQGQHRLAAFNRTAQRKKTSTVGGTEAVKDLQRLAAWLGHRTTPDEAIEALTALYRKDQNTIDQVQKKARRDKEAERQQRQQAESPPREGDGEDTKEEEESQGDAEGGRPLPGRSKPVSGSVPGPPGELGLEPPPPQTPPPTPEEAAAELEHLLQEAKTLGAPLPDRKPDPRLDPANHEGIESSLKKLTKPHSELKEQSDEFSYNKGFGGVTADWAGAVDRQWALRAIALFNRLIEIAGEGDEEGGRLDAGKLMTRLLSKQGGLVHAQQSERGIKKVLWLPDVSGSCSAISGKTLQLARSVCAVDDRFIINRHSNGQAVPEADDPFPYPEPGSTYDGKRGWAAHARKHDVGLAVCLGDTDAVHSYRQLADAGIKVIWLDARGGGNNKPPKAEPVPWITNASWQLGPVVGRHILSYVCQVTATVEGFVRALEVGIRNLK